MENMNFGAGIAFSLMMISAAAAQEVPRRGGILNYAVSNGEPTSFDCHAVGTSAAFHRLLPHYSSLLKFDPANYPELVGDIAESWTISTDGLVYEFVLRPNIKFHDGTALTSADVKASFDRIRNPPAGVISVRQQFYKDIESVEASDPRKVIFRLKQPNAAMITYIAMPWNCIYSASLLASDPDYPARKVMGSGPFKFKEYVAGSVWRGERFNGYFRDGRPYLDGFNAYSFTGSSVANGLAAGQVAVDFRGMNPPDIERVVAARGAAVNTVAANQSGMLMATFNTERPPFSDPRVRRALSLAIDRWGGASAMAKIIYYNQVGGYQRAGAPFARSTEELEKLPGYERNMTANRAEARRLLAEAGQSDLKATFLNHNSYITLGVFLLDQWRQIGANITHDPAEPQRLFASRATGNYDILLDSNDYVDEPSLQFAPFVSFSKNPNNMARANDPKFDEMFDRQQKMTNITERKKLVSDIEAYLADQSYSVPLFYAQRMMTIDVKVRGYVVAPQQYIGQDLVDVWMIP